MLHAVPFPHLQRGGLDTRSQQSLVPNATHSSSVKHEQSGWPSTLRQARSISHGSLPLHLQDGGSVESSHSLDVAGQPVSVTLRRKFAQVQWGPTSPVTV